MLQRYLDAGEQLCTEEDGKGRGEKGKENSQLLVLAASEQCMVYNAILIILFIQFSYCTLFQNPLSREFAGHSTYWCRYCRHPSASSWWLLSFPLKHRDSERKKCDTGSRESLAIVNPLHGFLAPQHKRGRRRSSRKSYCLPL